MNRLIIPLLFCIPFLFSFWKCTDDGPIVKVYVSKPDLGGLQRKQTNELVRYDDSLNFRCLDKLDFDRVIEYCFKPDGPASEIRQDIKQMNIEDQERAIRNIVSYVNQEIEG